MMAWWGWLMAGYVAGLLCTAVVMAFFQGARGPR